MHTTRPPKMQACISTTSKQSYINDLLVRTAAYLASRFFYLLVCSGRHPIADVVLDASSKKHRFLVNNADLTPAKRVNASNNGRATNSAASLQQKRTNMTSRRLSLQVSASVIYSSVQYQPAPYLQITPHPRQNLRSREVKSSVSDPRHTTFTLHPTLKSLALQLRIKNHRINHRRRLGFVQYTTPHHTNGKKQEGFRPMRFKLALIRPNLFPEPRRVERRDIDPVQGNAALTRLVKAGDEGSQGTLPFSACPSQSKNFSRHETQGHPLKNSLESIGSSSR